MTVEDFKLYSIQKGGSGHVPYIRSGLAVETRATHALNDPKRAHTYSPIREISKFSLSISNASLEPVPVGTK